MKRVAIGTVIADRTLDLSPQRKVVVRIGKPRKSRGDDNYFCPFEIHWPDRKWIARTAGVDSVQALYLAMQSIGADLYASAGKIAGSLTWLGMRDLGFPIPAYAADLLPKKTRKKSKRTGAHPSSRTKVKRG